MWKYRLEWIFGLIMLAAVALVAERGFPIVAEADVQANTFVVVVDPGHGGQDPGKVGVNNSLEKEINLEIALKLKAVLEREGVTVYLTRTDDNGLYSETDSNKKRTDLSARITLIEEKKPDLVISVHQNSYPSQNVTGPQTFYYKSSEDGKRLAETIQSVFLKRFPDHKRQAKANGNYYLLLHTSCPTVIAECGFLSNWEEAELLKSPEYQEKMAGAIAEGIMEYLRAGQNTGEGVAQ